MTCQYYQPRKCWKHADLADSNITCLGDCSKCSFDNFDDVPTLGEVRELYKECAKTSCRTNTLRGRLVVYERFVKFLGGENQKAILDDNAPTRFIQQLKSEGVGDHTIKSYVEGIAAMFGKKACKYYKMIGKVVAPFPEYDLKVSKKKWISLTREQRMKIRQYQFDCYNLSDPRKYLSVTGAWERGARKSDVLRFHWSKNFVEKDGAMWWTYKPVKTKDKCKEEKICEWPIDPDTWMMVKEAKRRLSRLHVQRLGNYHDSYLRVRDFTDDEIATSEIWEECGKDLRDIMGWCGSKSMHNLRKDATDQVFQNLGIEEACRFSGDTEKIIRDHYAAEKRIDPRTISIAKM